MWGEKKKSLLTSTRRTHKDHSKLFAGCLNITVSNNALLDLVYPVLELLDKFLKASDVF
jgi:hypothetical protein